MVTAEELEVWAERLCKEMGLPACQTMVHVRMDDYVGIIGEEDGGCIVVYEVEHPEKYCVSVEKSFLKNRQIVHTTLHDQLKRYKEFMESADKQETIDGNDGT